eukprot:9488906-Pyramimonas_sp.AAC.3
MLSNNSMRDRAVAAVLVPFEIPIALLDARQLRAVPTRRAACLLGLKVSLLSEHREVDALSPPTRLEYLGAVATWNTCVCAAITVSRSF